jgi:hypothetical protein
MATTFISQSTTDDNEAPPVLIECSTGIEITMATGWNFAYLLPHAGFKEPIEHGPLWVSAFEILSHPRSGKANLMTVLDLLAKAEWEDAGLKATRFKVKYRGKTSKINLIQKLHCELYRARNDFLHGNPVTPGKLFPKSRSGGPTLLHAAPLIYRAALMGFLPFKRPTAKKGDIAAQVAAYMTVSRAQGRYERAVASCKPKVK